MQKGGFDEQAPADPDGGSDEPGADCGLQLGVPAEADLSPRQHATKLGWQSAQLQPSASCHAKLFAAQPAAPGADVFSAGAGPFMAASQLYAAGAAFDGVTDAATAVGRHAVAAGCTVRPPLRPHCRASFDTASYVGVCRPCSDTQPIWQCVCCYEANADDEDRGIAAVQTAPGSGAIWPSHGRGDGRWPQPESFGPLPLTGAAGAAATIKWVAVGDSRAKPVTRTK
jgi:hypothetical protein